MSNELDRVLAEIDRLNLTWEKSGSNKIRVINPASGHTRHFPAGFHGRALDNTLTELRRFARDTTPPTQLELPTPERSTDMPPREDWWPARELLMRARRAGVTVWVAGGVLHTSSAEGGEYLQQRLHDRAVEIIPLIAPDAPAHTSPAASDTIEEESPMPKIGDTATIITSKDKQKPRPPKKTVWNVAEAAKDVWELLRAEARAQGDRPLTWEGREGVLWEGSIYAFMRELDKTWTRHEHGEITLHLRQTLNAHCDSPYAKPTARWWLARTWNNGGLTVTTTAAAGGKHLERPAATAAKPDAPAATALERLMLLARRFDEVEAERDQALAERDQALAERDQALAKLDEVIVERDTLAAYKQQVDAVVTRLGL